ncbi:MAG: alpha-ribazole phosphatase [Pseudomonadota bacterium]
MALILLRHTTPQVAEGICYGQTDLPLADHYESEVQVALEALPDFNAIITSPLTRCKTLAEFIGLQTGLAVNPDTRLMEMDFGTWEGVAWDDIPRSEIDAWAEDFLHARPHGGESVAMLRDRSVKALTNWQTRYERPLIVTHSGVIKVALSKGDTAQDFNAKIDFGAFVTISSL